jgi:competence protein ComEC
MNHWNEYPFVRLLFAFLAGIILDLTFDVVCSSWLLPLFLFAIVLIHFIAKKNPATKYRLAALTGLCFQLLFFLFGNILTGEKTSIKNPSHFTRLLPNAQWIVVKITEPPLEKEKSFKLLADVMTTGSGSSAFKTCGTTLLYLQKDTLAPKLKYGDVLLIKNNVKEVPGPKNPDEFDYKQYLWYKQIYTSAYLKSSDWIVLPVQVKNPLFQFTFWLRESSLNAIKKYIPREREAAVAEALIIGYRDDMSFETQQSYTAAGVVHVLAVSGLHVGILFAFLHQLLFFLNRKKYGRILQAIVILTIIWLFAMLSGLSGSVVRAATMFSFVTIGKNLKRPVNLYNLLAASALLILLFNPLLAMDAGLQLSYFAVIGIGLWYKPIDQWIFSENKIVNFCWTTFSMSIAAQLATLPVTIFYFNQFPTYFLFANLAVIPAAAIILYLGIALIVLQVFAPIAFIAGQLTSEITWLMNEFILRIQQQPASVLLLPKINLAEAVLLSGLIVFAAAYFMNRKTKWLFGSTACALLIVVAVVYSSWNAHQQKTFTVYSFRGEASLEFREGSQVILFTGDSISGQNRRYLDRHWQLTFAGPPLIYLLTNESAEYLNHSLLQAGNFFQFENFRIAIVKEQLPPTVSPQKMALDAIILSSNPDVNLVDVISHFQTTVIVFDGTNSQSKIKSWEKEAGELKLKTFNVATAGAFTRDIQ